MAAARYWRINGIRTWGGGDLELSELHLHDASGRADAAASLTCSHAPIAGALSDLQDATTATLCRFAAADVRSAGFWLQWDFGAGGERDIVAVNLGTGTAQATCPETMAVESFAAGATWSAASVFGGILYPGLKAMSLLQRGTALDAKWSDFGANASTLDVGGLVWTSSTYIQSAARANVSVQSGKWYWELTVLAMNTSLSSVGNALNFGVWPVSKPMSTTYIENSTGVRRAWQAAAPGDIFGFAFDADAGTLSVYRNGAAVGGVNGQPLSMSEPWAPVVGDDNYGGASVRANFGASAFTFSAPGGYLPLASPGSGIGPRPVRPTTGAASVAASAPVPAHSARSAAPLQLARDVEFGGPGTIYGTTKTKGTPNTPTKARVVLQHQRSKLPVRETWSDPVTGNFVFTGIDTAQQFLTLAEDAAGNFRPVAASRLTPEVLP